MEQATEQVMTMLTKQRFSDEETNRFRVVIKAFNDLYYKYPVQTWGNTKWKGVRVQKTPTDLWVYQELIHVIRPDVIIETGTGEGGSALYFSDMMRVMSLYGKVITIDINQEQASKVLEHCPNVYVIQEDSVSKDVMRRVKLAVDSPTTVVAPKVMVILDSEHSKEHVLKELELYAPLVSPGSMLVVGAMNVEGPRQAVEAWLPYNMEFEENHMCEKFMLTFSRGGYLEKNETA